MGVIIVGGGFAGCAAAIQATKLGLPVTIIERAEKLGGLGQAGGIMNNNGRLVAANELRDLDMGEMFDICEQIYLHKGVDFPGHHHADLFDVRKISAALWDYLTDIGVEIITKTRITGVKTKANRIEAVTWDGGEIQGEVFIDATGNVGPQAFCVKEGGGCARCIVNCPNLGGRVSLSELCGIEPIRTEKSAARSGSCELHRHSLSDDLQKQLTDNGVAVIPLPESFHISIKDKVCQQYSDRAYSESLVLLDTGHIKVMRPIIELDLIRQLPGLEQAMACDPRGHGNSMRFEAFYPHNCYLMASGFDNLFLCGETLGPIVGLTEAIVTGSFAGKNAALSVLGEPLFSPPEHLAVGDILIYLREVLASERTEKITFSGATYFERMKKLGMV